MRTLKKGELPATVRTSKRRAAHTRIGSGRRAGQALLGGEDSSSHHDQQHRLRGRVRGTCGSNCPGRWSWPLGQGPGSPRRARRTPTATSRADRRRGGRVRRGSGGGHEGAGPGLPPPARSGRPGAQPDGVGTPGAAQARHQRLGGVDGSDSAEISSVRPPGGTSPTRSTPRCPRRRRPPRCAGSAPGGRPRDLPPATRTPPRSLPERTSRTRRRRRTRPRAGRTQQATCLGWWSIPNSFDQSGPAPQDTSAYWCSIGDIAADVRGGPSSKWAISRQVPDLPPRWRPLDCAHAGLRAHRQSLRRQRVRQGSPRVHRVRRRGRVGRAAARSLMPRRMHQPLARMLAAEGLHVVTLDLLGHGRSDRPADPLVYSMTAWAEQVVALLDHLGAAQAVVGGTSLGANAASRPRSSPPSGCAGCWWRCRSCTTRSRPGSWRSRR